MSEKLLKFISLGRQTPEKRDAVERRGDFAEIYQDYQPEPAADQAATRDPPMPRKVRLILGPTSSAVLGSWWSQ